MNRRNWKCLLIGVVVAVVLSSAAPQADAQWAGWYRPTAAWGCGYSPCYSSCYSPCYTPCYSSCYATASCYSPCGYDSYGWYAGWRPGPIRRLLLGRYRWYWGGYWGGCCPTYDTYSCCGDGSMTAPTGAPTPAPAPTPAKKPVIDSTMPSEPAVPEAPAPGLPATPAMPGQPEPAMPSMPGQPEPAMPKTSDSSSAETGVLTVWVPYDAKVTINGLETRSTGSRRQFVSYGLKPGLSYKYVVLAQVLRNGEVQEDTRTVSLTAGDITAVAFGFNVSAEQVAATR
jgi:uncharacterized protein (TIGR03000 family)